MSRHIKLPKSSVKDSFKEIALEKKWINPEQIEKKASINDLSLTDSLDANISKLIIGLKDSNLDKFAEEIRYHFLNYKKAENDLYNVTKNEYSKYINLAHPKGSHKMENMEGDAVVEDLYDTQSAILNLLKDKKKVKVKTAQEQSLTYASIASKLKLILDSTINLLDPNVPMDKTDYNREFNTAIYSLNSKASEVTGNIGQDALQVVRNLANSVSSVFKNGKNSDAFHKFNSQIGKLESEIYVVLNPDNPEKYKKDDKPAQNNEGEATGGFQSRYIELLKSSISEYKKLNSLLIQKVNESKDSEEKLDKLFENISYNKAATTIQTLHKILVSLKNTIPSFYVLDQETAKYKNSGYLVIGKLNGFNQISNAIKSLISSIEQNIKTLEAAL